jgi:multiple sugar transport system ATP-binding protein
MNFLPPGGGPFDVARADAEVGVRPEQVRLGEGEVEAEVEVVEPGGNETLVHVVADGHRLVARAGADVRPPVGASVRVSVGPELHYFDPETGERR